MVSGVVAMWLLNLQLDHVVLDPDVERLDGGVGGQGLGRSGAYIEDGAVARALDRAAVGIELPVGERAVVMGAAVLDRTEGAVAVEEPALEVLPLDDASGARRQLGDRADVEGLSHVEALRRQSRPRRSEMRPC